MLMRFEPFREFNRSTSTEEWRGQGRTRQVPVDAYRRGDEFKVYLDLPGVDPGSIDLTIEKDLLTVRATRTWDRSEEDEIQVAERAQGEFTRQLFLGESLDRDNITAVYHDGVLMITIPVTESSKPKKVEVLHVGSVAEAVEAATVTV
jgi:HSP20 family protein